MLLGWRPLKAYDSPSLGSIGQRRARQDRRIFQGRRNSPVRVKGVVRVTAMDATSSKDRQGRVDPRTQEQIDEGQVLPSHKHQRIGQKLILLGFGGNWSTMSS